MLGGLLLGELAPRTSSSTSEWSCVRRCELAVAEQVGAAVADVGDRRRVRRRGRRRSASFPCPRARARRARARRSAGWPRARGRASRSSGLPESGRPCSNASTAIREATSPACAPPIPSATTNTGARANDESSLSRRWRPVSVLWIVSAARACMAIAAGRRTRSRRSGSGRRSAAAAVRSSGSSLRYVPLVEPRSSITTTWPWREIRA